MDVQQKFERAFQKAEILTRTQGQKRTAYKEINLSHDGQRFVLSYVVEKDKDKVDKFWLSYSGRNRLHSQRIKLKDLELGVTITDQINVQALVDIVEDRVKVEEPEKRHGAYNYR